MLQGQAAHRAQAATAVGAREEITPAQEAMAGRGQIWIETDKFSLSSKSAYFLKDADTRFFLWDIFLLNKRAIAVKNNEACLRQKTGFVIYWKT